MIHIGPGGTGSKHNFEIDLTNDNALIISSSYMVS